MRTSRLFRLIIRVFLLLLASSMSLVSFLGGYSALLILGDEDNIDLDINFEGDPFLDPNNFEIDIEFEINNLGYFDLEDLEIELRLYLIYGRLNQTNLEKNIIAITADHSTPCSLKTHSDDPVPLLIASEGIISDGTADFSEKFCAKGSLGELEGKDLMSLFIKFAK